MLASFQSVIARDLTDSCSITYLLSIQSGTKLENFHFSFYPVIQSDREISLILTQTPHFNLNHKKDRSF